MLHLGMPPLCAVIAHKFMLLLHEALLQGLRVLSIFQAVWASGVYEFAADGSGNHEGKMHQTDRFWVLLCRAAPGLAHTGARPGSPCRPTLRGET